MKQWEQNTPIGNCKALLTHALNICHIVQTSAIWAITSSQIRDQYETVAALFKTVCRMNVRCLISITPVARGLAHLPTPRPPVDLKWQVRNTPSPRTQTSLGLNFHWTHLSTVTRLKWPRPNSHLPLSLSGRLHGAQVKTCTCKSRQLLVNLPPHSGTLKEESRHIFFF